MQVMYCDLRLESIIKKYLSFQIVFLKSRITVDPEII